MSKNNQDNKNDEKDQKDEDEQQPLLDSPIVIKDASNDEDAKTDSSVNLETESSKFYYQKLVIAILIIIGSFSTAYVSKDIHKRNIPVVRDRVFEATDGINAWFQADVHRRNNFIIFCSLLMDINCLATFYRWVTFTKTYRFIICLCFFYGVRAVLQFIFEIPYPDGYNWGFPGVMSIFVPYGRTDDFFYSGHVGICMLTFLEFSAAEWPKFAIYSLVLEYEENFSSLPPDFIL